MFLAPNGKQLLSRICESGNSCFKVDYIPVVAGLLCSLLYTTQTAFTYLLTLLFNAILCFAVAGGLLFSNYKTYIIKLPKIRKFQNFLFTTVFVIGCEKKKSD